jgi:hypothetical protein
MSIRLSKAFVDDDFPAFPDGVYKGTLDRIEGIEFGEQGTDDWTYRLQLYFRDITPATDGGTSVGNRPFRGQITIIRNGVSLADVVEGDIEELDFMLDRGLKLVGQLALVTGMTERDEQKGVTVDVEALVDAARSGEFDGMTMLFRVGHWTDQNGSDRDELRQLASAS